jgi:hypothetical protein
LQHSSIAVIDTHDWAIEVDVIHTTTVPMAAYPGLTR